MGHYYYGDYILHDWPNGTGVLKNSFCKPGHCVIRERGQTNRVTAVRSVSDKPLDWKLARRSQMMRNSARVSFSYSKGVIEYFTRQ